MEDYFEHTWNCILRVRTTKPLVTLFTNIVTVNFATNITLAVGASPVVTTAPEELPDIMQHTQSFLLNMGTPDASWIAFAKEVINQNTRKVPVVFDPVGVGFSQWRNTIAQELMQHSSVTGIHVIRGNASEIIALANILGYIQDIPKNTTKGVDTTLDTQYACESARMLAQKHNCVVMISGEVDYVIDSSVIIRILGGNALMPTITGMGCSLTACIAAMCGAEENILYATVAGAVLFSAMGAKVGSATKKPGSFVQLFWDSLFTATLEELPLFCSIEAK